MKNSRKMFFLIETVLLAILMLTAFVMLRGKNGRELERISVIVQDSDASRWTAFRYGLKMAAEDQGIELSFVGTEGRMSAEKEQSLMEQEIKKGTDAVIIQPAPEEKTWEMLKKMEKKVPIMLIGRLHAEKEEESYFPATEADPYAMGADLARELLKDYSGTLKGKTLGILSEAEGIDTVTDRERGFLDTVRDAGGQVLWSVFGAHERDTAFLWQQEEVDFVIALDDSSLAAAGRAETANDLHGALIYGIGSSTEAVYYLDSGSVECLIVPDEFNIGYRSLTEVAEKLGRFSKKMQDIVVSHTVIRRENLFSKENQELLYTMNQ